MLSRLPHAWRHYLKFIVLIVAVTEPVVWVPVVSGNWTQSSVDLVAGSRKAIIETGFSELYFDQRFELVRVVNNPGDIRVIWRFSLGAYQVLITDEIGYYTESQKKIPVHSVSNTLAQTKDIPATISRQKARALMRACIGSFTNEGVVLMRFSASEPAALYLTAHAVEPDSAKNRIEEEAQPDAKPGVQRDAPDREDVQKRPRVLGYIDLATGGCSKGEGVIAP